MKTTEIQVLFDNATAAYEQALDILRARLRAHGRTREAEMPDHRGEVIEAARDLSAHLVSRASESDSLALDASIFDAEEIEQLVRSAYHAHEDMTWAEMHLAGMPQAPRYRVGEIIVSRVNATHDWQAAIPAVITAFLGHGQYWTVCLTATDSMRGFDDRSAHFRQVSEDDIITSAGMVRPDPSPADLVRIAELRRLRD